MAYNDTAKMQAEIDNLKNTLATYPSVRVGTAQLPAIGIGAAQDVTITYDQPFPPLAAGKTVNDIRAAPALLGLTVSLLGKVTAQIKTKSLTGCVVTVGNSGLVSLSAGTLEVIAVLSAA